MRVLLALTLALAACAAPPLPVGSQAPSASPARGAVAAPAIAFDGARAKTHLEYFTAPQRGGRFTASAGYDDAARYLADQLRAAGVEPYGDDGTYFQKFAMPLVDLAATPTLELADGTRRFKHRVDFTETIGGSSAGGSADGRVVFGATGARSTSIDDMAGLDVAGAIVVLVEPDGSALRELVRGGAAGALIVSDRILKYSYIPRFDTVTLPQLIITEPTANALIADSGKRVADLRLAIQDRRRAGSGAALSFATGTRARFALPLTPIRQVTAMNVVGILRGTDPDLAKTAVLVGGHLDGVGTDPDGTVFQAANDNASGPAVTAELARVIAARRSELRRSVIFVAFAAEEQGLWGSDHFATNVSAIPGRAESLVAFINLDVVGCCGTILGISEESPKLRDRLAEAADAEGVSIRPFRGSSDHASFARRRVEVAEVGWVSNGPIHTTDDVASAVAPERLATVGRVVGRAILGLAAP